jgi:predicted RNA polymerase sigma factor
MLLHDARRDSRTDETGAIVLLEDQDRSRWDRARIAEGLDLVGQALRARAPGPYAIQAAIAALHAQAPSARDTDWPQIAALYGVLAGVHPSPVVELNRAVAVAMAEGPAAGLAIVEALGVEPSLKTYHLLPGVRGDLLVKLGRAAEARAEFERAAAMTRNAREREVLLRRARECGEG